MGDEGSDKTPHWKLSEVSVQYDAADVLDVDNFAQALEATVRVSLVRSALGTSVTDSGIEDMQCMSTTSRKRRGEIDYITLANRWQIPLEKAERRYRLRLNVEFVLACILHWRGVLVPMIGCCAIGACHVTYMAILYSSMPRSTSLFAAMFVLKFLQQTSAGTKHTEWRLSPRPMRPSAFYSSVTVYPT